MHAYDFLIYNRAARETVEAVRERLPQANIVPPFTLVIEAIDSVDGCTLMVSTKEEEVLRVLAFICKQ